MICRCYRCSEELTAPVFINGKPYGWSCAKLVNPGMKKPNEKYVKAESHDFNKQAIESGKVKVIAIYAGKKYAMWFFKVFKNNGIVYRSSEGEFDGQDIYIRCSSYKNLS